MEYKPILLVVLLLSITGIFMTLFITPFVSETPSDSSALTGLINFIENGVSFDLPVLGNMTFSPVTWFWLGIDSVTNWVVSSLTALSYLPDMFSIPIVVLIILSILFVVLFLISNLIPFT